MTRYILQRLALLPLLMVIYSFVIFAIIQAPPGDFLTAYVATLSSSGSSISADQIAALRHQYGLDQPFAVQYALWMKGLLHGDFGLSLEYQRPNADLIGEQLGPTIALALLSFVYFNTSIPGLYSPEFVDARWSFARVWDLLGHIWLPALVLGIAGTARLSRIMRANLLDELNKPYVVTARAKGMKEWRVGLRFPGRLALHPLGSTHSRYTRA